MVVFVKRVRKTHLYNRQDLFGVLFVFPIDSLHFQPQCTATCGDTEIAAANIKIAIGKLTRATQPGNVTGFGAQFEVTITCLSCLHACLVYVV